MREGEMMAPVPLPLEYFTQPTLDLARDMLGKTLWRRSAAGILGGMIVETEAYISAIDPASHNYRHPSPRAATMFGPPGHAYIYLTYGMYHCLNVVSEPEGQSAAVLIRALSPWHGIDQMQALSPKIARVSDLARGPGRLCRALALSRAQNGADLTGDVLWLSDSRALATHEDRGEGYQIATSPRIGISQGTDLLWRFYFKGHPAVSGPTAWR